MFLQFPKKKKIIIMLLNDVLQNFEKYIVA
jgi:hypothetical protein